MFSLVHYQHFQSASLALLWMRGLYAAQKCTLPAFAHGAHPLFTCFLCSNRKRTNFMPTTFRRFESERWETPAGLCQTHLSCPRQKMRKSQRQMETFLKYIGVPVNFPQGLPCGRLKPVWSDLHPCSFLTRPELMSCAPFCPAWRALSRSFTSALIPPFPQFHSPAPASAPLWSAPRSERLIWTSGTNRFRTQIVFRNKFESSKTTQSTQKLILHI